MHRKIHADDPIDKDEKDHAIYIAKNIINAEGKLDNGLNNSIMKDHSLSKHGLKKSYFISDDKCAIAKLIHIAISNPDKHKFKSVSNNDNSNNSRLVISKKISNDDSQKLFGKDYVGYSQLKEQLHHIALCFSINGINYLNDSTKHGMFFTGFPVKEDYNL